MPFDIRLGDKFDVLIGEHRLPVVVQGLQRSGLLHVTPPTLRMAPVPLQRGEMLQMLCMRGSGLYNFFVSVAGRAPGPPELLILAVRSPITKHQRREFVRFATSLSLAAVPIFGADALPDASPDNAPGTVAAGAAAAEPAPAPVSGETLDISGGGLRFRSDADFFPGQLLELTLYLDKGGENFLVNRIEVIRCDATDAKLMRYVTCARFPNISDENRKLIIKYIFEQQLRLRR
ncbi:MAG: PilZ domain-containing protein [Oscillospiraceae bacterium]|jgi:c-di-GMP-binding flagellar brake protein YcgR|nr:PilZ domain-containing protein [Oscillospiraceae bacterium]